MKLRRESEAFLYPGQRRWYILMYLSLLANDLVVVLTLGHWKIEYNGIEELYWERFIKIDEEY